MQGDANSSDYRNFKFTLNLRAGLEIEANGTETKEEKPKSTDLSRLLYCLKNDAIVLAAGVLPAVALGFVAGFYSPGLGILSALYTSSFYYVFFMCFGPSEPLLALSLDDLSQGARLFWNDGVVEAMTKIYNAPTFKQSIDALYSNKFEGAEAIGSSRV